MHWFKGSKRWLSTTLFLTEAETLAISLWFSLLILCSVERTWICSDIWTYLTNYRATLKAVSVKLQPVSCHAPPQHPVQCRNTLQISHLMFKYESLLPFWFFFFFCFSIKICLEIVMNESGFARRVTVHSQLFNDFNYLLELGENLTACRRQH